MDHSPIPGWGNVHSTNFPDCFQLPNRMTYLIALALHLGGLALGLRHIQLRTPKRWTLGQTKDIHLNSNHRVHWIPMD